MEALDKVPLNYADSNLSKVSAVAFVALVVGADIVPLSIVVGYQFINIIVVYKFM